AFAALQAAAGGEGIAAAALRLARHWHEPLEDDELVPRDGTVRERLAALATFVRIGLRLGDEPADLIGGVLLPFELRSARPDELPADPEDQLALCVLAEESALEDLAHVAS